MAKKRKTLPKEIDEILKRGDVEELKKLFARCEPNALRYSKYGSNIFSLSPLPREFAFWAKEQGADVNFKDYYGKTPIFNQVSSYCGDTQLLIDLGADVTVTRYDGTTLLHIAAMYGRIDAINALLNAGLDVNAKAAPFRAFSTPLDSALDDTCKPFSLMLEVCTILLNHGAQITDKTEQLVIQMGENFQRIKREIENVEFLNQQTEALEQLYKLFHVEPVKEIPFHDGISPIIITETEFHAQFKKLWDYLVPPRGQAQTAQGEAIRIAGRIDDELCRNGGANWDNDYRKMLDIFPQYVQLGNPLSKESLEKIQSIVHILKNGQYNESASNDLCVYAVGWVLQNTKVLPPLPANYNR